MKVLFDHQALGLQRVGGVSRYICCLAANLSRMQGMEVDVLAPLYVAENASLLDEDVLHGLRVPDVAFSSMPRRAANHLITRAINRRKRGIDIFHETYYTPRDAAPPSALRLVTVYDMIHEKFPELFSPNDRTSAIKRQAVQRADHVICISEATRRDLIDIFGTPAAKVSVVLLGHGLHAEPATSLLNRKPFLLYVGSRYGYKNFEAFLQEFASSKELRNALSITCFGGGALSPREKEMVLSAGLPANQVIQMEGDDQALGTLYSTATALVYPSLYEGFGIPPLEAMSHGCAVICSNAASLPEVVGDAAQMFDPADPGSMRQAMEAVAGSEAYRGALALRGMARQKLFSWSVCAVQTAEVYASLLRR